MLLGKPGKLAAFNVGADNLLAGGIEGAGIVDAHPITEAVLCFSLVTSKNNITVAALVSVPAIKPWHEPSKARLHAAVQQDDQSPSF